MIRNFSDHAANERTFLAWVRTAIAVIAFGFVVERFDLFLAFFTPASLNGKISIPRAEFGQLAGLILMVLGIGMIVIAAVRFVRTAKEIDRPEILPGTGSRIDLILATLVVLLTAGLAFYLVHALSGRA